MELILALLFLMKTHGDHHLPPRANYDHLGRWTSLHSHQLMSKKILPIVYLSNCYLHNEKASEF